MAVFVDLPVTFLRQGIVLQLLIELEQPVRVDSSKNLLRLRRGESWVELGLLWGRSAHTHNSSSTAEWCFSPGGTVTVTTNAIEGVVSVLSSQILFKRIQGTVLKKEEMRESGVVSKIFAKRIPASSRWGEKTVELESME